MLSCAVWKKKLYATLKMFLFQTSKIEESVVLVLQVLNPETEIFIFLQLVYLVLYVRSDILHYILVIYCLINIQKP